jgi:hypothetical protein
MNELFFQLILAVLLGGLIGFEREFKKKMAEIQTYPLVCLSSCLFSLIAFSLGNLKISDSLPILIAVAVGMGFIGVGAIFKRETQIFWFNYRCRPLDLRGNLIGSRSKVLFFGNFLNDFGFNNFLFFGLLEEKFFKK